MNAEGKFVLIVENDIGIANMIRAILGIVAVPVVHVQSINDAEDALTEHKIGLIISEKEMNGPDGYSLLKFARAKEETKQIPFIMLIREGDNSHEKLSKDDAADRYITKPFTAKKVLDVVKEFIVQTGL